MVEPIAEIYAKGKLEEMVVELTMRAVHTCAVQEEWIPVIQNLGPDSLAVATILMNKEHHYQKSATIN